LQSPEKENLRVQKWVAAVSLLLMLIKVTAYYITQSVAILTDALESMVNVAAGFLGLYSLYVAAKPRDEDHPYGHGKAEFLSAGVEGSLILVAGAIIIYKSAFRLFDGGEAEKIDKGIYLIAFTAIVNAAFGLVALRRGKKNNSIALMASGKHLLSDTWTTAGIIVGLIILHFTGWAWMDAAVAILFGLIIIYTGYKIVRGSIAGIMDEADVEVLTRLVNQLNRNRRINWVDLHNLRTIKYGAVLHVDCHLTVPWYLNVHEAHREIDALEALVKEEFGPAIELFVHSDGCLPFSCKICAKHECAVRQHPFEGQVEWTLRNISQNQKHSIAAAGNQAQNT